jgi:hypothetical protein
VGLDLERARELAFLGVIDAGRDFARRGIGGVVLDEGGVALVAGAHTFPVLVNVVARLDPAVRAGEVLERANAFFGARQRGFTLFCLEDRDDDLAAEGRAAGLAGVVAPAPLMAIDAPAADVPAPPGVSVQIVTEAGQVDDMASVCGDAYSVYGVPAGLAAAILSPASVVLAPHVSACLASDEEGSVATAQAVATHGTAYLQWVATRQRGFRRGLGAAVTTFATARGFELGASMATLLASSMGAPLYRRLGWSDVGTMVSLTALTPPAG